MRSYQKPVVLEQQEMSEGVYLASGETGGNGTVCQSIYRKGVHMTPIGHANPGVNTMGQRGCEGCPADQGGACRLDLGPFGSELKPTWEKRGFKPDDDYVYM